MEQISRLSVLSEISKALIEAPLPDYCVILPMMSRKIADFLGDLCVIHLVSDDKHWLTPFAYHHPDSEVLALAREILESTKHGIGEGLTGRCLKERETIFIPKIDPQKFLEWLEPQERLIYEKANVQGVVVVPMLDKREPVGVLCSARMTRENPYTTEDKVFLENAAHLGVIAVKNTQVARGQVYGTPKDLQDIRGQFISAASHALRNPLAIAKSAIEDLKDGLAGSLNKEQMHYVDIANRGIGRLAKEIEIILRLEQLQKRKVKLSKNRIDLKSLMNSHIEEFKTQAIGKNLVFESSLPDSSAPCFADAELVGLLLKNLFDNALKFAKSQLKLELSSQKDSVRIGVFNDGVSLSRDRLNDILNEPFIERPLDYRIGVGFGLMLCKKIVDLHKGKIWAEAADNEWAKFYVLLPCKKGI